MHGNMYCIHVFRFAACLPFLCAFKCASFSHWLACLCVCVRMDACIVAYGWALGQIVATAQVLKARLPPCLPELVSLVCVPMQLVVPCWGALIAGLLTSSGLLHEALAGWNQGALVAPQVHVPVVSGAPHKARILTSVTPRFSPTLLDRVACCGHDVVIDPAPGL